MTTPQHKETMRFPIRKKLYIAFGAIISLVFALGALTVWQLRAIARFDEEASEFRNAELGVKRMSETVLRSRGHEKDYFADGGNDKHQRLLVGQRKVFEDESRNVRTLLHEDDAKELVQSLGVVEADFKQYSQVVSESMALFQTQGDENSGLQRVFRNAVHRMEEVAREGGSNQLGLVILELHRAEEDFLLSGDMKFVSDVRAMLETIRGHASRELNDAAAARIRTLAEEYETAFVAASEVTRKLHDANAELQEITDRTERELDALGLQTAKAVDDHTAAAAQGRSTAETVIFGMFALVVLAAVFVAQYFGSQMQRALGALTAATRAFADGDLSRRVVVDSSDEIGLLAKSFNEMADSLQSISNTVDDAVVAINQVVSELQASVSEQAASMQQQAASVSETVATVDEISHSANHVADVATTVMKGSSRSQEVASEGRGALDDSVSGMQDVREQVDNIAKTILELSEKTHRIGGIITTVEDFAAQSSMLSLNASIEAARGGQEGKAFAVVAAEVRKLAEQSRQATDEVRAILNEIQQATHTAVMVTEEGSKRVDRGVELVGKAGAIISQLTDSIERSADSAKQIAAASRQQSSGMDQISSAMSGIESFSRQNLEAMRQTESTSKSLAVVSQQLKANLSRSAA